MATRPIHELIIDRTSRDVQLLNNKGNYNIEDLNRIGEWQNYIAELLNEYGYYVQVSPKTDFVKSDLQNMTSHIRHIKNDLQALKDAYYVMQSTPDVPSTSRLAVNYIEANNMEKILMDLDFLVHNMEEAFIYCGTIYCGE